MVRLSCALWFVFLAASCPRPGIVPAVGEGSTGLSPVQIFVRASLDTRGIRPSRAEIQILHEDPSQLSVLLDGLLEDERFQERVKDIFAPAFRTRVDFYPYVEENPARMAAIREEPLELIAYVAENDLPYTEVVLADHTVVGPSLFEFWPLEEIQVEGELPEGTVAARYDDRRTERRSGQSQRSIIPR